MTHRQFIVALAGVSASALLLTAGLLRVPPIQPFAFSAYGAWSLYLLYSVLQYFLGRHAAFDTNKAKFIGVVQLLTALKMGLTVLFVAFFVKLVKPETNWFVLPILVNYVLFTIFETIVMMRVGKMTRPQPDAP